MATFVSSDDLNMDWNDYHFEGVAGTVFRIADAQLQAFDDGPGQIIPGLQYVTTEDPIDGANIIDGTLLATALAAGSLVPVMVDTLPALPDAKYPPFGPGVGSVVFLTTDYKLYRNVGDVWVKSVDGSDIIVGTVIADAARAGIIGATALAATIALLGTIIAGDPAAARCELNAAGFRVYAADGTLLVNLPTDGSAMYFNGQVLASSLTVSGTAEFDGAVNLAKTAVVTLQAGQQPPNA